LDMLGKGYEDQPSVVVEPPRRRIERRGKQMLEVEEAAFVKFSTEFKAELADLDVYALKVFIYIGLSINFETGTAYPGVRKIAKETNMNKDTVAKAIEELEGKGFLTVLRRDGASNIYKPECYFAIGETVPSGRTPHELSDENDKLSEDFPELSDENDKLSGASRVKDAQLDKQEEQEKQKRLSFLKTLGLDWLIAAGQEITQDVIDKAIREKNASNDFEKAFGFGTLPWSSNSTWTKFQNFIVKIYSADPAVFTDYVAWRKDAGKYTAFSNKKIRENPAAFMDTGYPEFEASKMYANKPAVNEVKVEATKKAADDKWDREFTPRPDTVPPPALVKQKLRDVVQQRRVRR
jgi:DNA replication protein DnaD